MPGEQVQVISPLAGEQSGIIGTAKGPFGSGVWGFSSDSQNQGILGATDYGVQGINGSGKGPAIYGTSAATNGVLGQNSGGSGQPLPTAAGLVGDSSNGHGVYGVSASSGVWKGSSSPESDAKYSGVFGLNIGSGYGVSGLSEAGYGVFAISYQNHAIYAQSGSTTAAAVYAEGDVRVTGDVLLLSSSGDVAEDFDVEDGSEHMEPGTVLVISSNGKLCASLDPYDTRVAGVVSGAGELKPAIVLQRIESRRPRCPIALVGKAFCKVDASFGSIRAGDLLTTSPTRGHAMKVLDYGRAAGAIVGKALKDLENAQDIIPILVCAR
jgi:hypothetical protein